MKKVVPKKWLGQHFLTDRNVARKVVESLKLAQDNLSLLEIGPGMGILTEILYSIYGDKLSVIEIDKEAVFYLSKVYPDLKVIYSDFLAFDLKKNIPTPVCIIGNFPYNISSQIFFKILEYDDCIPEVVCMVQKEVAERITSLHNSKTYGILSVLLQAYYKIEYLFTVHEHVFSPAPKVKSGVIRLTRNRQQKLDCEKHNFFKIVKTAFNQRRKTLRNALKSLSLPSEVIELTVFDKRAEQLPVQEFIDLTKIVEKYMNK